MELRVEWCRLPLQTCTEQEKQDAQADSARAAGMHLPSHTGIGAVQNLQGQAEVWPGTFCMGASAGLWRGLENMLICLVDKTDGAPGLVVLLRGCQEKMQASFLSWLLLRENSCWTFSVLRLHLRWVWMCDGAFSWQGKDIALSGGAVEQGQREGKSQQQLFVLPPFVWDLLLDIFNFAAGHCEYWETVMVPLLCKGSA